MWWGWWGNGFREHHLKANVLDRDLQVTFVVKLGGGVGSLENDRSGELIPRDQLMLNL